MKFRLKKANLPSRQLVSQGEGRSFLIGARVPSIPSLELPGPFHPPTSGELN